jgi:O-antigen ligase
VSAAVASVPQAPARAEASERAWAFDLPEALFLVGAFVAPLNLLLVASLTVYDLIIGAVAFLLVTGPRRLQPVPPYLLASAYLFLLAALVSTFRATEPVQSFTQILQFAFIFFVQLPVVLTLGRSPLVVRWSVALVVAGSIGAIALAYVSHKTQGAGRDLVFFSDNPNRLGYPSAYLLPFVLYFGAELWRRSRAVAASITGVLLYFMIWALAGSASRSATIGVMVALVVFIALRPGIGIVRLVRRLLAVSLVVGAVGWVLWHTTYFPLTLRTRIQDSFIPEDQSVLLDDRERLARAGIRAFEHSPFIGTGLDNFRFVAPWYYPAATHQLPHNVWLQSLAQVGLIGTLALVFLLVRWFITIYLAYRVPGDRSDRELLWAFFASIAALMAIFLVIPEMIDRHYWLLIGLGLALAAHHRRQEADP